jgi:hypothetical protein
MSSLGPVADAAFQRAAGQQADRLLAAMAPIIAEMNEGQIMVALAVVQAEVLTAALGSTKALRVLPLSSIITTEWLRSIQAGETAR